MKRTLNIIGRAVNDFDFEFDMNDSMQDVLDQASNVIMDNVEYDYISECESNKHYDHISWNDGKGLDFEADGEFICGEERNMKFFRKDIHDVFTEVAWYEHEKSDYILMDKIIDTDGKVVMLVAK